MNAALLMLTEAWRYEQVEDTDLSPEFTAAKWYEIYVQYLSGECGDVGCCTQLRTDPNTGRLQASEDGGVTWFDVAEGPWVDAPNVASAAPPPPLAQGSDEADRCLAAWNAADVIAEFYRQTAGAAAAGLYNTLLSMNMFLNELNNALLEIAYPQAGRLLNASGFLDFDWGEYAEAPTLDSTAMDALRCLLFCNATVASGIVSFDHGAVYANLIAELGINPGTAVTLLVGYMGEEGLNHAGGILANETADCDCPDCAETWSYEWDFEGAAAQLGWQPYVVPGGAQANFNNSWGFWSFAEVSFYGDCGARISPTFPLGTTETHFTRIEAYVSGQGLLTGAPLELGGATAGAIGGAAWIGRDVDIDGPWQPVIGAFAGSCWAGLQIRKVRVEGEGFNPWA